jgi:FkbM family methyltransferase
MVEAALKRIKYASLRKVRELQLAVQGLLVFKNQRTYASLLHRRGQGRQILETRDGIRLYARENVWDARIIREIFVQRPYLRGFHDLPSAPLVVDVGGYIGDFSVYAARRMNASRVIVYEPTSENWRMLVDNIALNHLESRVVAVNKAVGESGTLTLNVDVAGQEIHSSAYWYPEAPKREVPSITLDELLDAHELTHVDLLKVDCEGGEYGIFTHASDEALARIQRFTMEWHLVGNATQTLRGAMVKRLGDSGFRMWENGQILRGAR